MPKEDGRELVEKHQSEEDGLVWRPLLTRDRRPRAEVRDASKLFKEDGSVTIDPIQLRDACQCSLCVDGSTLQRKFLTAHIPTDIKAVFQGRSTHGRVKVGWENDIPGYPTDHQSVYSQSYLRALTSPLPDSAVARKRHYWDGESFQKRVIWTSYTDFINKTEAYKTAMSALHRDGLIFITEVDETEEAVGKMAERIGPIRNTFYGSTWDVRSVVNSKNVAYTNQHLGFHMDLLYMTNPPGYQLLHCLKNSCSGGESRFADSFYAATRLRRHNEEQYRHLCRHPVEWIYENAGQFYLERRPTFQAVHHFVGNEEYTRHQSLRREKLNNDADLAYVNWSPPFQGKLHHNLRHPERTRDFVEATKEFDRILNSDDMVVELKMGEGTCAIFENRRVVHARNAFKVEEGARWLRGAYVDEDAFWSRCHTLGADQYDTTGIEQPKDPIFRKYQL
jgi:alpha-ketoglutarate-dependent taurine dioxygenase